LENKHWNDVYTIHLNGEQLVKNYVSVSSSGQFSCLPTVSISIIHTGRHISKPSLLESTNTTCWFLGVSATSVRCNLAFNFSIFWKRTPTTLYIYNICL